MQKNPHIQNEATWPVGAGAFFGEQYRHRKAKQKYKNKKLENTPKKINQNGIHS